jgi:hypothetical protein
MIFKITRVGIDGLIYVKLRLTGFTGPDVYAIDA